MCHIYFSGILFWGFGIRGILRMLREGPSYANYAHYKAHRPPNDLDKTPNCSLDDLPHEDRLPLTHSTATVSFDVENMERKTKTSFPQTWPSPGRVLKSSPGRVTCCQMRTLRHLHFGSPCLGFSYFLGFLFPLIWTNDIHNFYLLSFFHFRFAFGPSLCIFIPPTTQRVPHFVYLMRFFADIFAICYDDNDAAVGQRVKIETAKYSVTAGEGKKKAWSSPKDGILLSLSRRLSRRLSAVQFESFPSVKPNSNKN